jgi:DNA (cytosine-5)-methyltransferase 1
MTTIAERVASGEVEAPDVLVGGTPCQSFSIAGLRRGLLDQRGQLTLAYVRLLDAIDSARAVRGQRAAIANWENVPGVLSDAGNAFGCFLAALAGEDEPLVPGDPPTAGASRWWRKSGGEMRPRWPECGLVVGPARTVAWRVLDAQHFGVPQRRRRVFLVASAREDIDPLAVLAEFDGVRRDSAPRRDEGNQAAGNAAGGAGASGCWWDGGGVSQTLDAVLAKSQALPEKNRFPAVLQPVPVWQDNGPRVHEGPVHALRANDGRNEAIAFNRRQAPISALVAPPLDANHPAHAVSTGLGVRYLLPLEAERLQGMPDEHTMIPWRGKPAEECPDGPRRKAVGNSMAVPCMAWIGRRLDAAMRGAA